jgi:transcriptional regulator with XRE-family HTH domain
MTTTRQHGTVGPMLKVWRQRRGRSQENLALQVGVSTRHLSFVETGRAKPSPEVLLALAAGLDVPLRERNALLLAAGYAPRYRETALDDHTMTRVRRTVERLLDRHSPYPGAVLDRQWNVVLANAAASRMTQHVPPELRGPQTNAFRLCLHPDGLARYTLNFGELADFLLEQLHRLRARAHDDDVEHLAKELLAYPNVAARDSSRHTALDGEPLLLVPWQLDINGARESYLITLTKFATPQDITLDELTIELFYPADDATEAALRAAECD